MLNQAWLDPARKTPSMASISYSDKAEFWRTPVSIGWLNNLLKLSSDTKAAKTRYAEYASPDWNEGA